MQLLIDEAITLAFVICSIPFCIINKPFFINALKLLNPDYSIPSHEVLSEYLLDLEVAKVIHKVDKILEYTSNLTIEYLYKLGNYSDQSYMAKFLVSQIELIINCIGKDKISAIISNNGANVVSACEQLCHTQTADIIPKIISSIAETVFKEFEKETLIDNNNIKMLNSAEDLYPNEQDLDLSILTSIDFKSLVFT
ncbi:34294_t:CDS:2, partial [Racocetra persica]